MIDNLRSLGLSTYESRALHAILKKQHTLKELIRSARVPAGKAYSVCKSLVAKGLVKESDSRPKVLFVESASNTVRKLIDKHQGERDSVVSQLQSFATGLDRSQGRSTLFFEAGSTNEDNQRIQLRVFREAKKEVLQVMNMHHKPRSNRGSKLLWEHEIEKAIGRGVSFRCIYPVKAVLPEILESLSRNKTESFQVRRLDLDYPRFDVVDGKKSLVKLVHEDTLAFGGVVFLEDKAFSQNLRSVFFKFWNEAKKR
ncbi:hypothetical protein JW826_05490 [Candidatus Woesearchaeota archaeon]|nr:hypothetical protein [Candidatus Woesearchaeota archaeon]